MFSYYKVFKLLNIFAKTVENDVESIISTVETVSNLTKTMADQLKIVSKLTKNMNK